MPLRNDSSLPFCAKMWKRSSLLLSRFLIYLEINVCVQRTCTVRFFTRECTPSTASGRHRNRSNAGLMLGHRRRRWTNINPALDLRSVFAGRVAESILSTRGNDVNNNFCSTVSDIGLHIYRTILIALYAYVISHIRMSFEISV